MQDLIFQKIMQDNINERVKDDIHIISAGETVDDVVHKRVIAAILIA